MDSDLFRKILIARWRDHAFGELETDGVAPDWPGGLAELPDIAEVLKTHPRLGASPIALRHAWGETCEGLKARRLWRESKHHRPDEARSLRAFVERNPAAGKLMAMAHSAEFQRRLAATEDQAEALRDPAHPMREIYETLVERGVPLIDAVELVTKAQGKRPWRPPGRKRGTRIERSEDEAAALDVLNRLLTAKSRGATRQELKSLRTDAIARAAAALMTQATRSDGRAAGDGRGEKSRVDRVRRAFTAAIKSECRDPHTLEHELIETLSKRATVGPRRRARSKPSPPGWRRAAI